MPSQTFESGHVVEHVQMPGVPMTVTVAHPEEDTYEVGWTDETGRPHSTTFGIAVLRPVIAETKGAARKSEKE